MADASGSQNVKESLVYQDGKVTVGPIVPLSDPRIARIPVADCGEVLADARDVAGIIVDQRQADQGGAFARLRSGALGRLLRAGRLLPPGRQLVLVEGYRPADVQLRYFEEYVAYLRRQNPGWTSSQLTEAASWYISPLDVAPHVTGGAADVTLADAEGVLGWMGTEVNATPEESDGASHTQAGNISAEARRNRTLLCEVMSGAAHPDIRLDAAAGPDPARVRR